MKKKEIAAIKRSLCYVVAGLAAMQLIREVPAIVRYFKMKRL